MQIIKILLLNFKQKKIKYIPIIIALFISIFKFSKEINKGFNYTFGSTFSSLIFFTTISLLRLSAMKFVIENTCKNSLRKFDNSDRLQQDIDLYYNKQPVFIPINYDEKT